MVQLKGLRTNIFASSDQTLTGHSHGTYNLVRRDVDDQWKLCRNKCGSSGTSTFRKRSSKSFVPNIWQRMWQVLKKRIFNQFQDGSQYLLGRFTNNQVARVYNDNTNGNSIIFEQLDNAVLSIGLEDLCGCTAVVVVSRRAVWFAHLL